MAWTTPKTDWATGELVAAADMNAVGENLAVLKRPVTVGGTIETIIKDSATFVDVDSQNMNLTITTTGGDVMAHFHCSLRHTNRGSTGEACFDIDVDGTRLGGGNGIMESVMIDQYHCVSFTRVIQNLSAGSHTFKLQCKENSGAVRIAAHAQFWVREI